MEYVVYLSESKIDMLYEQEFINEAETETEGELKLGPFTIKRGRKRDGKANRFKKLERVTSALADRIGTPFDDEIPAFVTDTLLMKWRFLSGKNRAVYWLGEGFKNGITSKVLLIGSERNVIGSRPESGDPTAYSTFPYFFNAYRDEFELRNSGLGDEITLSDDRGIRKVKAGSLDPHTVISGLDDDRYADPAVTSSFRFLAKRLLSEERQTSYGAERYIIATPLYVAQVD